MVFTIMIKLICGVSRAGKTTYSQRFDNVIHLDDMGKPLDRYSKVNELVSNRNDVVVEGIYDTPELRIALLNAYKGDEKVCIFLDPSEEAMKGRKHFTRKHKFTPPTYAEGWDEIRRITENGETIIEHAANA